MTLPLQTLIKLITFAVSIVDPPPTAIIKSNLIFLANSEASSKLSKEGSIFIF